MTGKIVHYRQRRSIQSIQPQHTDLRIHRPDCRHLIIRRQGIGMPHIHRAAILQDQAAVLHNPRLTPHTRTGFHGLQILDRQSHRLNGARLGLRMHQSMTMTGIKERVLGRDAQFLFQLRANARQKVILDPANASDRHGVDTHQHRCGFPAAQRQRAGVQTIVH